MADYRAKVQIYYTTPLLYSVPCVQARSITVWRGDCLCLHG